MLRKIINVLIGLPADSQVSLAIKTPSLPRIQSVAEHESRWTPAHVRIAQMRALGIEPPTHLVDSESGQAKRLARFESRRNAEGKAENVWHEYDSGSELSRSHARC